MGVRAAAVLAPPAGSGPYHHSATPRLSVDPARHLPIRFVAGDAEVERESDTATSAAWSAPTASPKPNGQSRMVPVRDSRLGAGGVPFHPRTANGRPRRASSRPSSENSALRPGPVAVDSAAPGHAAQANLRPLPPETTPASPADSVGLPPSDEQDVNRAAEVLKTDPVIRCRKALRFVYRLFRSAVRFDRGGGSRFLVG